MKLTKKNLDRLSYDQELRRRLKLLLEVEKITEEDYQRRLANLEALLEGSDGAKTEWLVVWDGELRGFGVRLWPSGKKSYAISYRHCGRKRFMKIGSYGRLAPEQARKRATRLLAQVDEQIDPLEERREAERRAKDPTAVSQLCQEWLENHAKRMKKESSWREDERRINKHIAPKLGHLHIDRVTRGRVDDLYLEITLRAPVEANRVLILLATIFAYAIGRGYLPPDFKNPAKRTRKERNPEKARKRVVRSQELPKLLEALDREEDVYVRSLFRLLLLTGLRKTELLHAKWGDLDLKEKTLHLPETKSGEPRTVPLSDVVVGIIRRLPRRLGNPFLFPSPTGTADKPMTDPKRHWRRIRSAAGCDDLQVHDLRRTVSYIILRTLDPKSAQEVLGHADINTTLRHYADANLDDARQALDVVAEKLFGEGA